MRQLILLLLLLLLIVFNCRSQKGVTNVRVGYENLVNPRYERIIGQKWIECDSCGEPGMYYIVEYDYGEPPPDSWEILTSLVTGKNDIRGWEICFERVVDTGAGDAGFVIFDVKMENKKSTFYLPFYTCRCSIFFSDDDIHLQITIKDD